MRYDTTSLIETVQEAEPVVKGKWAFAEPGAYKAISTPPGWTWQQFRSEYTAIDFSGKVNFVDYVGEFKVIPSGGADKNSAKVEVHVELLANLSGWRDGYTLYHYSIPYFVQDDMVDSAKSAGWKVTHSSRNTKLGVDATKEFQLTKGMTTLELQKVMYEVNKEVLDKANAIYDTLMKYVDEEKKEEVLLDTLYKRMMTRFHNLAELMPVLKIKVDKAAAECDALTSGFSKEDVGKLLNDPASAKNFLHQLSNITWSVERLARDIGEITRYNKDISGEYDDLKKGIEDMFRAAER